MDKEIIGNLTTIIKILIMTIAPTIAVYLGTDSQTVIAFLTACLTFLTACLTFALAVLDAKYPNTLGLFDNAQNPVITHDEEILNDEYVTGADDDGC